MRFNKILIAKNSPKNKCFAEEGEWLVIAQDEHKMKGKLPIDHHFFVGIKSRNTSRYGWVSEIDYHITAEDLAKMYTDNPSNELTESCALLLTSLQNYNNGTPMACTFSTLGILEKKRVLKVHKIIFFK